jgi:hypothetical protein
MLMRKRSYLCTKAKKTKNEDDWACYKRIRNDLSGKLRQAKSDYFTELSSKPPTPPLCKKVWTEVNRLLGNKRQQTNILKTGDNVLTEPLPIADAFSRHFSTLLPNSDVQLLADPSAGIQTTGSVFEFCPISEEDVLQLLSSIDANKATGVDEINGKMLRATASGISNSLTILFNASLSTGVLPTERKKALVTPVPKRNPAEIFIDYRPISVLPVVSKVLERLVNTQLFAYLSNNGILHPEQYGFRPGHSTEDVLISMVEEWRQALA